MASERNRLILLNLQRSDYHPNLLKGVSSIKRILGTTANFILSLTGPGICRPHILLFWYRDSARN